MAGGLDPAYQKRLLDWVLGEDRSNPPETQVPALERDRWYLAVLLLFVPLQLGLTLHGAWLAVHGGLGLAGFIGLVLAPVAYGHFFVEHNRGHHRHVATPEDPASSKMGETIYRFMFREMPGAYFRGWDLEVERLERQGKSAWSLDNEIIQGWIGTAIVWGGMTLWLGTQALMLLMVLAFLGAEGDFAQEEIAQLVDAIAFDQLMRPDDVAERLRHLLAPREQEAVHDDLFGERRAGRQQEGAHHDLEARIAL